MLDFLLNRVEQKIKGSIDFDPKRCLRFRLNSNTCDLCLTLCKREALIISGRKIIFSAERCTGCMACVSGCPNDAFVGGFDLLSLSSVVRDTSKGTGPVVLTCCKTSRFVQQIIVPCLGLLSAPVMAVLNIVASQKLYLDTYRCADCDNRHVLSFLAEGIQELEKKAGQDFGRNIHYATKDTVEEVDSGRQRRSLFCLVGKSIRNIGAGGNSSFTSSVRQQEQREKEGKDRAVISHLLQQTLDAMPHDAVQEKKALLSYLYTLEADNSCNLCPSCTGMCPSGALKRLVDGSSKRLVFTSARCSGCGLCVAFCKKKALTLRQGIEHSPDTVLVIAEGG